jgi:hypothetical protein
MQPTRWDALVLARAGAMALVALAVGCLVTAATDEGGVAWIERAGRTLPILPLCAALGVWVALAPVLARGESLALEALGRSPAQIGAAAVAGAALVAVVVAVGLGTSRVVDVAGFYPLVTHASAWRWREGDFVDDNHGLTVLADGAIVRGEPVRTGVGPAPVPPHGRAAAALAMASAGVALPMLVAQTLLAGAAGHRPSGPRRGVSAVLISGLAVVTSVLLFQAAAARHVPAVAGAVPPLLLLAFTLRRYREA